MEVPEKTITARGTIRRSLLLTRKPLVLVGLAVLLLGGALTIWILVRNSGKSDGAAALVAAYKARRIIEPRLSGGFEAGVFDGNRDDLTGIDEGELKKARKLITEAALEGDVQSQLVYARLSLLDGKVAAAHRRIRDAAEVSPESAEIRNDLGVCLMERGRTEDAVEAFDAALSYDPRMREGLFNRALCYRRLMLRDAAAREFGRLLEIEPDENWRKEIAARYEEATRPLTQLNKPEIRAAFEAAIEKQDVDEARRVSSSQLEISWQLATDDFLMSYLEREVSGDHDAAALALYKIDVIAAVFGERLGDSSVAELAGYLKNLPAREKAIELELMRDYLEVESLFGARKYEEAQLGFGRLGKAFRRRGNSMFEMFSVGNRASCLSTTGDLAASLKALQSLPQLKERRWPYFRTIFLTIRATTHARLGNDSQAISDCDQALQLSPKALVNQAKVRQIMMLAYGRMGDLKNALNCLVESTRLFLETSGGRMELAYNHQSGADLYLRRGNRALALLCAEQSLSLSQSANDNNRAAQTHSFAAVQLGKLKQFDQAEEQLRAAFDNVQKIGPGQRKYTEPVVLGSAGELAALRADLSRSLDYYAKAEALVEKTEGNELPLLSLLRRRAATYYAANDFPNARKDLNRAIGLIEAYRYKITDAKNRADYLDESSQVIDLMVALMAQSTETQVEAFDFSEQGRGRGLLDELSAPALRNQRSNPRDPGRPLKLSQVRGALPEDLRLISYSVTEEGTLAFVVTRSSFDMVKMPGTTEVIDRLVTEYVSGLKAKTGLDELTEHGRELYERLIKPLESRLADGRKICIIPDKSLHFLPFAALVDGSGQYFVQSHYLSSAPSATALVQCISNRRRKPSGEQERILAIGNPDFDREAFPYLEDLPDSQREARECFGFYAGGALLENMNATKQTVSAELKSCDVLHVAGHCIVDEKSPWLAGLVLAANGESQDKDGPSEIRAEEGLLSFNEIYGLSLPKTKLVILSACRSGLGQYYRGEGIVGLVRPFLALRVSTVVASLWSVDSRATAALMIEFHRQRKKNDADAGPALRSAQIHMAGTEFNHPYYWAPFTVIGYGE